VRSDRQGRFYGFTNPNTVVIVDPDALKEPSMMPTTVVESVLVDNEPVDPLATRRFVDPSRVEFEYTALNLRGAEATRFRYRLDGYDTEWVEARAQRTATYRNLPPGSYRFVVTAHGPEGVWNETGTSFAFDVVPVFWRTWWFQTSMALLGVSILGGLYRLRVRQLTQRFTLGMEARLGERTRIARELHDTLLQSFQGLMLRFQSARDLLPSDPAKAIEALDGALDRADQALVEGRDAIQNLRSSTSVAGELAEAIAADAEELTGVPESDRSAPVFRISVEGSPRDLHPIIRDDIHRIAREALHNAFRHADAGHVEAEVTYGARELRLRIRDDGKGIAPSHLTAGRVGHWGLAGMRERAEQVGAQLNLWSEAGAGTEVELRVPAGVAYGLPGRGRLFSPSRKQGSG
jgi:signal transduction histidine kinase